MYGLEQSKEIEIFAFTENKRYVIYLKYSDQKSKFSGSSGRDCKVATYVLPLYSFFPDICMYNELYFKPLGIIY